MNKYCREELINIFEDNGIYIENDDVAETLDIDSFSFVTLLIDIEQHFNINIEPEELSDLYGDENKGIQNFEIIILKKLGITKA